MSRHHHSSSGAFAWMLFLIIALLSMVVSVTGCHYPWVNMSDVGGYEAITLDMPFAEGYQSLCTQGANGTYSHSGTSTKNDIDFDTPNGSNDLVYAPTGGTAYVHMESSTRNFGYHVNIDRDDGTYVVLGHMSDIFVNDGSPVAAGEILGYEGCTGNCSGDHVHIGVHYGDAAKMAEFGTSEGISYYLDDVTGGDEGQTLLSSEFICGTSGGHIYGSKLPVGSWHPNGSLVKTPDASDVYLIEGGTRRWIENQDLFWSMGYNFDDVAIISDAELACYDVGSALNTEGGVQAVTDDSGTIWLLVGTSDDSTRYRIQVRNTGFEGVLSSWGLSYSTDAMPPSDNTLLASYSEESGYATFREGALVKETSKSDVYVVSDNVAMPIVSEDVLLRLGWGSRPIITVDDGVVSDVEGAVGSCASNAWCVDETAIESCATEGAVDLSEGGASDTGNTDTDTDTDTTTTEDPSSMLEGEIEDGEFGLVFLPPASSAAEQAVMTGTATSSEGNAIYTSQQIATSVSNGQLVYSTTNLTSDATLDFWVEYSDGMGWDAACTVDDGVPTVHGTLYAEFGGEELPIQATSLMVTTHECTLHVIMPHFPPLDTGLNDTALTDTGTATTDSGTADHESTICYRPGVTMSSGELYLDGGFFTHWDSSPAATARSGDIEMCDSETTVSGEQIKMNAWFLSSTSSTVEWAAYNNWCTSIDWQGSITVDGTAVSVTTQPWSASAWASDPCDTGGDAFFNIP